MTSLSLVTVVFEAELPLLALQARSLSRFVAPDAFADVVVIDNTRAGISRRWRERLLGEYGRWGPRVRFLRPDDICALPASRGWVAQQVLKLMVAEQLETDFYVVLDAKNHWVAPTVTATFVNPDGRARGASHSYREHPLQPTLRRTLSYLGVEAEQWLDHFPPTHTPFVLETALVRRLCRELAERGGRPFAEEFVAAGLAEFFTYSGWLIATFGDTESRLDGVAVRCANVWPRRSGLADFRQALEAVRSPVATGEPVPFLAAHRTALARADVAALGELADFWAERGLMSDRRAGLVFLLRFKAYYLATMSARKARTTGSGLSARLRARLSTRPRAGTGRSENTG